MPRSNSTRCEDARRARERDKQEEEDVHEEEDVYGEETMAGKMVGPPLPHPCDVAKAVSSSSLIILPLLRRSWAVFGSLS